MPTSVQDAQFLHSELLAHRQIGLLTKLLQHICELGYGGL